MKKLKDVNVIDQELCDSIEYLHTAGYDIGEMLAMMLDLAEHGVDLAKTLGCVNGNKIEKVYYRDGRVKLCA